MASGADEGRGKLRKAPGSGKHDIDPEMSEWSNPHGVKLMYHILNK